MPQIGTFFGVGVGPGDPELLTLKAARILREVDVVFASTQEKTGKSLALEIAAPHLRRETEVVSLSFAHTFEGVESGDAHRENAGRVLEVLSRPASAAFLTLGDPMTYSTFTYLVAAVLRQDPEVNYRVVPGITSFAAAAAASRVPLAEGDESFAVVSAAKGTRKLRDLLPAADNVVVMKSYRNTGAVCDELDAAGLGGSTVFTVRCSRPGEVVVRGTEAVRKQRNAYMSLFVASRRSSGGDDNR